MKKISSLVMIGSVIFILNACNSGSELLQAVDDNRLESTMLEKTEAPMKPTNTQEQVETQENHFPDGVLSYGEDINGVRLTKINGQIVDEWVFPGFRNSPITPSRSTRFHYGGSTEVGVIKSPCFFFSTHFGDPRIIYHAGKSSLIIIQEVDELIQLIGATGKPQVVFSSLDPENVRFFNNNKYQPTPEFDGEPTQEPPAIKSWLFAASLINEPVSEILLSRSDENGYSIYPLFVNMQDNHLIGVWYSLQFEASYGGGPIIFKDYKGLYYLDLETGLDQLIIKEDINFLALSPDQKLVAYKSTTITDEPQFVIHNIVTGENKRLNVRSGYNTFGVGDAHFSSSGKYLAWREVYLGEDSLSSIIQIADTTEGELIEVSSQELLNDPKANSTSVAGWLDDRNLLIEVDNLSEVALYIFDTESMSLTYLAPGHFIGFTYP